MWARKQRQWPSECRVTSNKACHSWLSNRKELSTRVAWQARQKHQPWSHRLPSLQCSSWLPSAFYDWSRQSELLLHFQRLPSSLQWSTVWWRWCKQRESESGLDNLTPSPLLRILSGNRRMECSHCLCCWSSGSSLPDMELTMSSWQVTLDVVQRCSLFTETLAEEVEGPGLDQLSYVLTFSSTNCISIICHSCWSQQIPGDILGITSIKKLE